MKPNIVMALLMPKNDPDYTTWYAAIVAAGGSLTTAQQKATNTLFVNLKSNGLWTRRTAIWVAIGTSINAVKFNLKDPRDLDAAYRLTPNGTWSYTTSGATPNGVSGTYIDTHLIPNSVLSQNNTSLSFYSKSNVNTTQVEMGSTSAGGNPPMSIIEIRTAGTTYCSVSGPGTYISYADANSLGYYIHSRTASNAIAAYKNGVSKATGSVASTGQATLPIYIGAWNNTNSGGGFNSTKAWIYVDVGDGLNSTDATTLSTIVNIWATTLGINEY